MAADLRHKEPERILDLTPKARQRIFIVIVHNAAQPARTVAVNVRQIGLGLLRQLGIAAVFKQLGVLIHSPHQSRAEKPAQYSLLLVKHQRV